MRTHSLLIIATLFCLVASTGLARADGWNNGEPDHWRSGNWYNGYHAGHTGWWWIVDGTWTYYPAPAYPYPDPSAAVSVDAAPTVIETATPAATATAQPLPHYFCADPAGYYPSIPQCNVEWQRVDSDTASGTQPQDPQGEDVAEMQLLENNFDAIDPTGQQAAGKLSELGKQIEEFRQSLYRRDYNAMGVMEKAEILEHHVLEMQDKVSKAPVPQVAAPQTATAPVASLDSAAPQPGTDQNQSPPPQAAPEGAVESAPQ